MNSMKWQVIIPCENCDDEAEYLLPTANGSVGLLCADHAANWYEPGDGLYRYGARRIERLSTGDEQHVSDTRGE